MRLAKSLSEAGFAVSVINPAQAHAFAKALLKRSKTDAIDAQTLAELGARRLLRYLVAWLLFTALSTVLIAGVASRFSLGYAWLAKPAVECALAILSFVTARYWIYR